MIHFCIILIFLFEIYHVTAVYKSTFINQDRRVIMAEVGDNVTLPCFFEDATVLYLSWYQQTLGERPYVILNVMKNHYQVTYARESEHRLRFSIQQREGVNNLTITNLHLSDSAIYYCGTSGIDITGLGQGTVLYVRSSKASIQTIVSQPASESVQTGDSVNLTCTIPADLCIEEYRVYWYRHDGSKNPVVYPSIEQYKNLALAESLMSSYLSLKNMSYSDTGTYYCAVVLHGELLFGNGTKVDVADLNPAPLLLLYCLIPATAVSIILIFILAYSMHKLNKRICSGCKKNYSSSF
ncbi:immunoglobulin kappa light chain-like [Lampris incognitus]|uniref:immunoglobulin kappa light chain-like n=1 Tax=Lampris incognitus TaxID=2546036 RepID=UPI0024B5ADD9|nr:immunoglobulin kappa light chain-like [Lampris incognitus]